MSSIPREALKTSASKPGRDRGAELDAERLGARDHFLRIGDIGGRDLVHHLGGRVAEHPLGADIEDLDDALRVGGDAGEIGAVEDRALQGPRLEQRRGALRFPAHHRLRGLPLVLHRSSPGARKAHPRRSASARTCPAVELAKRAGKGARSPTIGQSQSRDANAVVQDANVESCDDGGVAPRLGSTWWVSPSPRAGGSSPRRAPRRRTRLAPLRHIPAHERSAIPRGWSGARLAQPAPVRPLALTTLASLVAACGGATTSSLGDPGTDAAVVDAPAAQALDCVADAGVTSSDPGNPAVKDTLSGTNGVFTDSCDSQGNLVDYSCETRTVCGPGPNPDCSMFDTGRVVPESIDCSGHCMNGECDGRCPSIGQSYHFVAVGSAGAVTLGNDTDGRTYACTLITIRRATRSTARPARPPA